MLPLAPADVDPVLNSTPPDWSDDAGDLSRSVPLLPVRPAPLVTSTSPPAPPSPPETFTLPPTADPDPAPLVTASGARLYFRGRRVLEAQIGALLDLGLRHADEVLFSGGSAGGIGAMAAAGGVRQMLPQHRPLRRRAAQTPS